MAAILVMYPWGSVKVLSRREPMLHSAKFILAGSGGPNTVASLSLPPSGWSLFDVFRSTGRDRTNKGREIRGELSKVVELKKEQFR